VRNVPDIAWQKVTIGARHGASLLLLLFLDALF
jgi:hypothetical protein